MKTVVFVCFLLLSCTLLQAQDRADPFLQNNRKLLLTELAVRQGDALTTYMAVGSGMCPRCREAELPRGLSRSFPAMMAYSGAVSMSVDGLSALLWHHGHYKLARAAMIADAAADGFAVGGNVRCIIRYGK